MEEKKKEMSEVERKLKESEEKLKILNKELEQRIEERTIGLLKSEEKYKTLFDTCPDGIAITTLDGKLINFNQRYLDMLGYELEELKNINFQQLTPKKWHEFEIEAMEDFVIKGYGTFEKEYIRKDGTIFPISLTGWLIKDIQGNPVKIGAFIKDITKKIEAEQALKESEKKFRTIFNSIPDTFFLVSDDSTILEYQSKKMDLYKPPKEFMGKKLVDLMPHDIGKKAIENIRKTIHTKEPIIIQYSLPMKNQEMFYEARHLYFSKNKVAIFIRDITKRKKTEQKVREAFNRTNFYKDLFTHDISNILQNFQSSMDLIEIFQKDPKGKAEIGELIMLSKKQVNRGKTLVSVVNKLSKIEETDISLEPIEIYDVLRKTIRDLIRINHEKNINIQIRPSGKEFFIKANDLIIDVFENILINSFTHNSNVFIEITINLSIEQKNSINWIKIEFSDNGIGLRDDRKETIFQRGSAEDKYEKRIGLGLSLVKKIIDSYKGQIWVEDRIKGDYSKGSNFIILIPKKN